MELLDVYSSNISEKWFKKKLKICMRTERVRISGIGRMDEIYFF